MNILHESNTLYSIEFADNEHRQLLTICEKFSTSITEIVEDSILEAIRKGIETEMTIEDKACFGSTLWCDKSDSKCCKACEARIKAELLFKKPADDGCGLGKY